MINFSDIHINLNMFETVHIRANQEKSLINNSGLKAQSDDNI